MIETARDRGGLRRLWRGDTGAALILGGATLLGPIGGFFANAVYARTLGAEGRGQLAAVISALVVCEALLAFGFPDVLARRIAKRSISGRALRYSMVLALLGSLLPAVLVGVWANSRGFGIAACVAASVVVPVTSLAALGRGVLTGRRAFTRLSMMLLLAGVVRIASPLILIFYHTKSPDVALVLVSLSSLVAAIPILLARPFSRPPWAGAQGGFRRLATEALSLWPANLAWALNNRLDQLILAFLISAESLGLYAVCVAVAEVPIVLASGLRQVVLVQVSESRSTRRIFRLSYGAIICGLLGSVCAMTVGPQLLSFVFGSEFGYVANVLAILLVASGLIVASGLLNTTLIAMGSGRLTVLSQGAGLAISAGALFVVIPLGGGIVGAACVNVATYSIVYIIAYKILRRKLLPRNPIREETSISRERKNCV